MDYTNMPLTPPQVESEAHESVDTISTIDPYNLLNLTVITPCSSAPNAHNLALPMLYHLLTCGHIITINHPDRRCARNCHHTIPTPSSHSSEFPEPQYKATIKPPSPMPAPISIPTPSTARSARESRLITNTLCCLPQAAFILAAV